MHEFQTTSFIQIMHVRHTTLTNRYFLCSGLSCYEDEVATMYIKEMLISSFFPWFVVLASFTVRVIVYGITYTSGIVYVIILKNFQTGKAETSWISSIITTVMFATGKTFRRHKTH